ncbi:MAG: sulfotransferase domain-containing protein [Candidatus Omnitrophica bacterium]|nr:sulfotransferase domain-containing protein [Candidatus Omnitrophota bacterium]
MDKTITIVSGLPRSGTSMMMKMLEAGGIRPLIDNLRQADPDNPKGYYEYERVKKIKDDQDWLKQAEGKAVKMVSALLKHLPKNYQYKVIFMERKMAEILASQKKMLIRQNKPTDAIPDQKMAQLYQKHLTKVKAWLKEQDNIEFIDIDYNQALKNPSEIIRKIKAFLSHNLDTSSMVGIIDNSLYRQRQ